MKHQFFITVLLLASICAQAQITNLLAGSSIHTAMVSEESPQLLARHIKVDSFANPIKVPLSYFYWDQQYNKSELLKPLVSPPPKPWRDYGYEDDQWNVGFRVGASYNKFKENELLSMLHPGYEDLVGCIHEQKPRCPGASIGLVGHYRDDQELWAIQLEAMYNFKLKGHIFKDYDVLTEKKEQNSGDLFKEYYQFNYEYFNFAILGKMYTQIITNARSIELNGGLNFQVGLELSLANDDQSLEFFSTKNDPPANAIARDDLRKDMRALTTQSVVLGIGYDNIGDSKIYVDFRWRHGLKDALFISGRSNINPDDRIVRPFSAELSVGMLFPTNSRN